MRFLRQNLNVLLFLAVLFLACVMVLRQFMANQSAHVELREDFLLLHARGEKKPSERFYQLLIHRLPHLNDKSLVDDLQRTTLLIDPQEPDRGSLVWKYHVSVGNELQKRSERRLVRALERAEKQ
jgi:hypothetical protein